ncbi:MAG: (d)CMP kinase [Beijerinckiaceae bacterium]
MRARAFVVAIDGPAASGKGTIAKAIASHYGLPHLDTGLLYRATAFALRRQGLRGDDAIAAAAAARGLTLADLDGDGLRGAAIGEAASVVAAIPAVRAALVDLQRDFAAGAKGAVLDGRDIGTFICPQAAVKLFVTASPEERARRRTLELEGRGEPVPYVDVLADIRKRDERDSNRSSAPLKMAADAILLDTTRLDVEKSIAAAIAIVEQALRAN